MLLRRVAVLIATVFVAAIAVSGPDGAREIANSTQASGEVRKISCCVLEAHTSAERGVTVVIFHQSAKESRNRLSNLSKQNEGATVEWQSGDACG